MSLRGFHFRATQVESHAIGDFCDQRAPPGIRRAGFVVLGEAQMTSTDVIGVSDVLELLGLSLSTLERLLRDQQSGFPQPFRHGGAAKGRHRYWRRGDIAAYVDRKAREALLGLEAAA
jgi:predicted DNA-binding transcriptional regulator AlpA